MAEKQADAAASTPAKPAGTTDDGKKPDAASTGDPGKAAAEGTSAEAKATADAAAKTKADADAAAEAAKKAGPPEKYDLKVPEGAEALVDAGMVTAMGTRAKAKGWTNEQAQAELDEVADAIAAQSAGFRTITEADPTYGGEKLQDTQRLANLALDRFAPKGTPHGDELRADLARSGYGNKLSVLAFIAQIGKAMAEDRPGAPAGGGGSGGEKSLTEHLYGPEPAKT